MFCLVLISEPTRPSHWFVQIYWPLIWHETTTNLFSGFLILNIHYCIARGSFESVWAVHVLHKHFFLQIQKMVRPGWMTSRHTSPILPFTATNAPWNQSLLYVCHVLCKGSGNSGSLNAWWNSWRMWLWLTLFRESCAWKVQKAKSPSFIINDDNDHLFPFDA